jgi:hypothetical protein
MDNKEFDDIIKKKLESLNSEGTDDGWDLFREKWEQSSASMDSDIVNSDEKESDKVDELFDAKMKQNMRGLRMPFNSAHWIKLKAQLEAEALFKKRLFVAKTVEILMLSLIVVGILNLMPIQNEIYQIPVFDMPMVAAIQVDKATSEKHQAESLQKEKVQSLVSDRLIKKLANLDLISLFKEASDKTPLKSTQKQSSDLNTKNSEELINLNLEQLFPFLQDSNQNEATTIENQEGLQVLENSITSSLQEDLTPLIIPSRPLGFPDLTLGVINKKSDERSYISLAIGPKVNIVNSPFDPVYEIDPYNTLNTNFNITAKVHKEVGPLELYVGLGYSKTSYAPLIIEETYKNQNQQINQASLENIGFNTLNIPLGVKHNILNQDSYQLYATAGVNVNLIAQSDYELYDNDNTTATGSRTESIAGFKPAANSGKPEISQRALLSQKEFKNGILNGGSLRDNLYASASVGLGLIKNVSETTSIFIEPKYSHFISSQGLGPNLDKVHAISVDLGVRYQLN